MFPGCFRVIEYSLVSFRAIVQEDIGRFNRKQLRE